MGHERIDVYSHQTPMFTNDLFSQASGKKIHEVDASMKAYDLAVDLLDKYVKLLSAANAHYKPDSIYECLLYLSMNNGYAESAMDDLRLRYYLDASDSQNRNFSSASAYIPA